MIHGYCAILEEANNDEDGGNFEVLGSGLLMVYVRIVLEGRFCVLSHGLVVHLDFVAFFGNAFSYVFGVVCNGKGVPWRFEATSSSMVYIYSLSYLGLRKFQRQHCEMKRFRTGLPTVCWGGHMGSSPR